MTQTVEPATTTADDTANRWFADFEAALKARDVAAAAGMFATESYWRDLVSFTWNLVTVEGPAGVSKLVSADAARQVAPVSFEVSGEPSEADGVTEAWLKFETAIGRGTGHLRLNADDKAWTFLTTLDEIKGHEEPASPNADRPFGTEHGANPDRVTWAEQREAEAAELGYTRQPEVVVIGGGQGGIALGARLRQLGVETIIVERNEKPGDSWRKRYKSLALHDPVWYDHLPYLKFPDNWPVFSPKDKVADWLESYTKIM